MVRTSSEQRATQALAVIAKMIQRINLYEQMLEQRWVTLGVRDDVQEQLNQTLGTEAERSSFTVAEHAFLAVLKTKTDLLNAAQDIEQQLREELAKEKENHVVDVQNVKTHIAADIDRLEWEKEELQKEKEDLAGKLQATEKKFIQADVVVRVLGQKAVMKFT